MKPALILFPVKAGLSFKEKKYVKDNLLNEAEYLKIIKWEKRIEIYSSKEARYIDEMLNNEGMNICNGFPYSS